MTFIRALLFGLLLGAGFAHAGPADDVAAARALFHKNLDAIRDQDRDAYLECYLQSGTLARTGPTGTNFGYDGLAEAAGGGWPNVFKASDLQLTHLRDGMVYGTYRYRVRFGDQEQSGISERFFLSTDDGWKIAVSTAFPAPPGTPPPPRALVGATLIDGTGAKPVRDAVVVVRNGRVECAGRDCEVPEGIEVVDVSGRWITPGLVDAHVHFSQTGWADGRPDAMDVRDAHPYEQTIRDLRADPSRWYRCFLCSGVTAVFDVGGYPWTIGLEDASNDDTYAPHVAAAGPLMSTLDHWLNLEGERQFIHLTDEASAAKGVRYIASLGGTAVKVWFIQLPDADREAAARAITAVGDEAARAGLPMIVHATELEAAKTALRAGAKLLVHSVWDAEIDDEFIELARAAGTIYCPTITVSDGYTRMFESARTGEPPVIDDPNGCLDALTRKRLASTPSVGKGKVSPASPERDRRARDRARFMDLNLIKVHEAGIPIAMGTDAGNPLTLHGPSVHAEMEAMQKAGMAPLDVITSSTAVGAAAMGRADDFGTIEDGKIANLIVVAADPSRDVAAFRQLVFVMRGGVLRSLAELREVVEE